MIANLKKKAAAFKNNWSGWSTKRKILVIESDDWGNVRIPNKSAFDTLLTAGIKVNKCPFLTFDNFEQVDDFQALFETMKQIRNTHGKSPKITANYIMSNPDLKAIEASGFAEYNFITIKEKLQNENALIPYLAQIEIGKNEKWFHPQFHGREHLNVNRWMRALREDYQPARKAFELEFFQPDKSDLSEPYLKGFGVAYDPDSTSDIQTHREIITDGLQLFSDLFGYKASCFTAPALISNINIEESLHESGIRIIDVPKIEKMPLGEGKYKTRLNYIGKKSSSGARYITRTAVFEPNISESSDNVADCMVQISACFENRKPAIISNHRAAFMGEIVRSNREKGLMALEDLLSNILQRWPDVEFVDLDHLGQIIANDYK